MVTCRQTSTKSYVHSRKKWGTLPQLRWSSVWQGFLIWFWKGTKEFNRYTCHSKKKLFLGHLKIFNVKDWKTLKSSWKQEIKWAKSQAPTSRNCAAESLKFPAIIRLDQQKCNAYSHLEKNLFPIRCFHMVLLQDFIGKNVWDSYLRDSRRPQWK